jgi:hypothetical protein
VKRRIAILNCWASGREQMEGVFDRSRIEVACTVTPMTNGTTLWGRVRRIAGSELKQKLIVMMCISAMSVLEAMLRWRRPRKKSNTPTINKTGGL